MFGYVKHMGDDDNKRIVVAFAVKPVTNFNEITMHMYEVIYAMLFKQKVRTLHYRCENSKLYTMTTIGYPKFHFTFVLKDFYFSLNVFSMWFYLK